jgi:hypothetical protein
MLRFNAKLETNFYLPLQMEFKTITSYYSGLNLTKGIAVAGVTIFGGIITSQQGMVRSPLKTVLHIE